MKIIGLWVSIFVTLFMVNTSDATIVVPLYDVNNPTHSVGTITATNTPYGLLLTPQLTGLTPGLHGFHLHIHPDCANQGLAAGGHLDPSKTNQHAGPYVNTGHLGDLPALYVDQHGQSTLPVLAPRLLEKDITQHALMIHQGGDNYHDQPLPLGGGGNRVACGVVP